MTMRRILWLLLGVEERARLSEELDALYRARVERDGAQAAQCWLRSQYRAAFRYALTSRLSDISHLIRGWRPVTGREVVAAVKSLGRTPGAATVIVLTVAIGLGAVTALFATIRSVVVAPLPYEDAGAVAWLYTDNPPFKFRFSVADYRALEADHPAFESVAAYQTQEVTAFSSGAPVRVTVKSVTGSYFGLLGQRASLGRLIDRADDRAGTNVIVLTHNHWQQAYGGDAGIVGTSVALNGVSHTIVGVLEPSRGPLERNVAGFTAERWAEPRRKGPFMTMALGRLRSDVPPEAVRETLRATNTRLFPIWQSSYQDRNATWNYQSLKERVVGDIGPVLWILFAGFCIVLLIAVSNAVHLLVSRALDRRREWAIRRALGGTAAQLRRPLVLESLTLGLAVCASAVAVAVTIVRVTQRFGGAYLPRVDEITMSLEVWLLAGALSVLCALAFLFGGLLPALSSDTRLDRHLRGSGRALTEGRGGRRTRRALVSLQLALTTPLLVAAVMATISLRTIASVPLGVDVDQLLTARVSLTGDRYREEPMRADFWPRLLERIRQLPGVEMAALADSRPPDAAGNLNNFDLEDRPTPPNENQPLAVWVSVTPDYFKAAGLRLERGQRLDRWSLDDNTIVVDRAWADRFFPGEEVIGKRLKSGGCTDCPWTTVTGVVGTVKWQGLDAPDEGTVYTPFVDWPNGYVVVRAMGEPAALADDVRRVIGELDGTLAVTQVSTGRDTLDNTLTTPRYLANVSMAFGLLAFLLAAAGLSAILGHFVRQHRNEMGIRLALGGQPRDIQRLVLRHSLSVVGMGVLGGSVLAVAGGDVIASRLYGATDALLMALGLVVGATLVLAVVMAVQPSRQVARIDPAHVLRDS
jgi:predicted permease